MAAAMWQPTRPASTTSGSTGHRSAAGPVRLVPRLGLVSPTAQSTPPRSPGYHSFRARPAPRFDRSATQSPPALATSVQAQAVGGTLLNLGYFAGVTDSSDRAPDVEPPDTQVATGPTDVVEAVNSTLAVYSRSGHLIQATDLDLFFGIATHSGFFFSDPRIVYDNESGRFILTGMGVQPNPGASDLYLAVSATSDPTGTWIIYQIDTNNNQVDDQPKVGVDSDKIVVSWQAFDRSGNFVDVVTEVIQKSDATAGAATLQTQSFAPDSSRFGLVPAISLSPTTTEYVVYNNSCGPDTSGACTTGSNSLGVIAITGTPAARDVASTEADPAIAGQAVPPPAEEPQGSCQTPCQVDTGDDRMLSAVWRNGVLWSTASDACTNDRQLRSCGRIIEVTTSATPSLRTEVDLTLTDTDVYYPAITVDSAGDPFVVTTISSLSKNPTVAVFGESGSSGGFKGFVLPTPGGSQTYLGARWGDYSGASIDPVHPDDVWLAGEYAIPLAANRFPNWATIIDDVTLSSPTVTSISPRSGSAAGGTSVTVTGTNFTAATAISKVPEVDFGSRASAHVSVQSPTRLVASAPPEGGGPVHVTVKTADGRSPATAADVYTYPVCSTGRGPALPDAVGIAAVSLVNGCSGYLVTDRAGQVSAFGSAVFHGDLTGHALTAPIIGITATAGGKGYWLLAADGGVFTFGDARFYGSTASIRLNAPVVAMAVTPTGKGYWILAKDGGIFTFGDARFFGSTGNIALAKPIDGMAVAPGGNGYWLVAQDGGVFTFTRYGFYGSLGGVRLAAPIVGMTSAPSGRGYTLVGSDGGVFTFGAAPFYGSLGAHPPASAIVDLSTVPADNGYYLVDSTAHVYAFGPGAAFYGNA